MDSRLHLGKRVKRRRILKNPCLVSAHESPDECNANVTQKSREQEDNEENVNVKTNDQINKNLAEQIDNLERGEKRETKIQSKKRNHVLGVLVAYSPIFSFSASTQTLGNSKASNGPHYYYILFLDVCLAKNVLAPKNLIRISTVNDEEQNDCDPESNYVYRRFPIIVLCNKCNKSSSERDKMDYSNQTNLRVGEYYILYQPKEYELSKGGIRLLITLHPPELYSGQEFGSALKHRDEILSSSSPPQCQKRHSLTKFKGAGHRNTEASLFSYTFSLPMSFLSYLGICSRCQVRSEISIYGNKEKAFVSPLRPTSQTLVNFEGEIAAVVINLELIWIKANNSTSSHVKNLSEDINNNKSLNKNDDVKILHSDELVPLYLCFWTAAGNKSIFENDHESLNAHLVGRRIVIHNVHPVYLFGSFKCLAACRMTSLSFPGNTLAENPLYLLQFHPKIAPCSHDKSKKKQKLPIKYQIWKDIFQNTFEEIFGSFCSLQCQESGSYNLSNYRNSWLYYIFPPHYLFSKVSEYDNESSIDQNTKNEKAMLISNAFMFQSNTNVEDCIKFSYEKKKKSSLLSIINHGYCDAVDGHRPPLGPLVSFLKDKNQSSSHTWRNSKISSFYDCTEDMFDPLCESCTRDHVAEIYYQTILERRANDLGMDKNKHFENTVLYKHSKRFLHEMPMFYYYPRLVTLLQFNNLIRGRVRQKVESKLKKPSQEKKNKSSKHRLKIGDDESISYSFLLPAADLVPPTRNMSKFRESCKEKNNYEEGNTCKNTYSYARYSREDESNELILLGWLQYIPDTTNDAVASSVSIPKENLQGRPPSKYYTCSDYQVNKQNTKKCSKLAKVVKFIDSTYTEGFPVILGSCNDTFNEFGCGNKEWIELKYKDLKLDFHEMDSEKQIISEHVEESVEKIDKKYENHHNVSKSNRFEKEILRKRKNANSAIFPKAFHVKGITPKLATGLVLIRNFQVLVSVKVEGKKNKFHTYLLVDEEGVEWMDDNPCDSKKINLKEKIRKETDNMLDHQVSTKAYENRVEYSSHREQYMREHDWTICSLKSLVTITRSKDHENQSCNTQNSNVYSSMKKNGSFEPVSGFSVSNVLRSIVMHLSLSQFIAVYGENDTTKTDFSVPLHNGRIISNEQNRGKRLIIPLIGRLIYKREIKSSHLNGCSIDVRFQDQGRISNNHTNTLELWIIDDHTPDIMKVYYHYNSQRRQCGQLLTEAGIDSLDLLLEGAIIKFYNFELKRTNREIYLESIVDFPPESETLSPLGSSSSNCKEMVHDELSYVEIVSLPVNTNIQRFLIDSISSFCTTENNEEDIYSYLNVNCVIKEDDLWSFYKGLKLTRLTSSTFYDILSSQNSEGGNYLYDTLENRIGSQLLRLQCIMVSLNYLKDTIPMEASFVIDDGFGQGTLYVDGEATILSLLGAENRQEIYSESHSEHTDVYPIVDTDIPKRREAKEKKIRTTPANCRFDIICKLIPLQSTSSSTTNKSKCRVDGGNQESVRKPNGDFSRMKDIFVPNRPKLRCIYVRKLGPLDIENVCYEKITKFNLN